MAADRAPAQPPPLRAVLGGRGRPALVRATTTVALGIETRAFAIEVMKGMVEQQVDIATGKNTRAINNAGRLGLRAQAIFHEAGRLLATVED